MKRVILTLGFLLCAVGMAIAQCGQPEKRPAKSMSEMSIAEMFPMHFNPVSAEFNTAAQPTPEILKEFKDKGFKAVINLRTAEEDPIGEEAVVKKLGLRYFHIPVVYPEPKFEQADEFLKVTDNPENRPLLIHCTVNIRAGAFFMIRRILRDGWTFEDALKEAERAVRIAPHYQQFVKDYVARANKPATDTKQTPVALQLTIPVEGLDVVLLADGKEVQGKESISVARGKYKYIFASEENKTVFEKDPARYEIGEYCQRMGAPAAGNADLWAMHEGKIYIFGSDDCIRAFKESPMDYIEPVLSPWKATAQQVARGRELLEKSVAAMGGTRVIDQAHSFREVRSQKLKRGETEFEATTEVVRAYPDGLRQVQVRQFGTIVTAFSGADGFVQFTGGDNRANVRSTPTGARALLENAFLQDPFFLLRARKDPGFRAASAGTGKVGEDAVEWIEVEAQGQRLTLGIDPASGNLLSISQVTRGPGGKYGNVQLRFSDYRAEGGLNYPRVASALFNDQPVPAQSYSVALVEVNPTVDAALFEKPKSNP